MKDVQKFAAEAEPVKNDHVKTPFGDAVITDVGYGFVISAVTGDPMEDPSGQPDDLIRVRFGDGSHTFIYRSDIERNYTAEKSILRA